MSLFMAQFALTLIGILLCVFLIVRNHSNTEKYWLGIMSLINTWLPSPINEKPKDKEDDTNKPSKRF